MRDLVWKGIGGLLVCIMGISGWLLYTADEARSQPNNSDLALVYVEGCEGVPTSDTEYARVEAEQGDSNAQYVYASYLSPGLAKNHDIRVVSDEAIEWLYRSAEQGHIKAQGFLCSRYIDQMRRNEASSDDLRWCFQAAYHNHRNSQATLGRLYYDGIGVSKDNEKSYFWYKLAGNPTGMTRVVAGELTPEQLSAIDQHAEKWQPKSPEAERNHNTAVTELVLASRNNPTMPLNVAGLVCGGEARNCKEQDRCGSLIGYYCQRGRPEYIIADKETRTAVSSCEMDITGCLTLVPDDWTCPSPRNMPLTRRDQEKFSEYKSAISCGDVLGVDRNSGGDGPYFFINKITGETLAKCSFWHGPCQSPKEWACGRPSNYDGGTYISGP